MRRLEIISAREPNITVIGLFNELIKWLNRLIKSLSLEAERSAYRGVVICVVTPSRWRADSMPRWSLHVTSRA